MCMSHRVRARPFYFHRHGRIDGEDESFPTICYFSYFSGVFSSRLSLNTLFQFVGNWYHSFHSLSFVILLYVSALLGICRYIFSWLHLSGLSKFTLILNIRWMNLRLSVNHTKSYQRCLNYIKLWVNTIQALAHTHTRSHTHRTTQISGTSWQL